MAVDPERAQDMIDWVNGLPSDISFDLWLMLQQRLQITAMGEDPGQVVDLDERKDFARWNITAAILELGEALEEVPWKPWASTTVENREAAIGEVVDALHFIANFLLLIRATGMELTAAYKKKNIKNLQRQIDGYDGKKEKCKYCNRELPETTYEFDGFNFCSEDHANKHKEIQH